METESMERWENPVAYWRKRSRQALENQGVRLLPPAPAPPTPTSRQSQLSLFEARLRSYSPRPHPRPRWLVASRLRIERVGLDLICKSCGQHISKSQKLMVCCLFFRSGPSFYARGLNPLTRCFMCCPNCNNGLTLGRNIRYPDRFMVFVGATQHFPPEANEPDPETYPDSVMDSPTDIDDDGDGSDMSCQVKALAAAFLRI